MTGTLCFWNIREVGIPPGGARQFILMTLIIVALSMAFAQLAWIRANK